MNKHKNTTLAAAGTDTANSDIQHHLFDNGFRVIHEEPSNQLPITYIRVFCNLGSIHETDQYHGASHFIEHMCFKGTSKMSNANQSQISIKYDEIGAYINAHTEKQYTCYIIKCNNRDFPKSIQVLSDMMNNSLFDKREYIKEKHVVLEETILLNDQPNTILFNMVDRLLYKGSSYEYPIDAVEYHDDTSGQSLNYNGIVHMYKTYYQPSQMVLSIVTQIPFTTVIQTIRKTAFAKRKPTCMTPAQNAHPNYSLYSPTNRDAMRCTVLHKKGIQATYFGIGFRTCSHMNPDKYTLDLVKLIIGGYMSSRLFQLLRHDQGLTYSSKVYTEYFKHTGKFFIYTTVDHDKIIKNSKANGRVGHGVIPIIIKMLNDLVKSGVTSNEIATAKGFIKGNMMLLSENGDNQGFYNGLEYLLYDNPREIVPYAELYDQYYNGITRQQIHQTIQTYFNKQNMYVVCVGEHAPTQSEIIRECAKLVA